MRQRLLRLTGSVLALLVGLASPASADPAGPTNYRTELSTATLGAASLEVFGGDSFLVLRVPAGHEAMVHGYEHRPQDGVIDNYLRFDADGTVWVNERSQARWLNEDRYAQTEPPADIGADLPPEWVQVADDGAYAWHDHRIHWMSPDLPSRIDPSDGRQEVLRQSVPITVDGEALEVVAIVTWIPPPGSLGWLGVGLVAAVLAAFAGRRGTGVRMGVVAVAVVVGLVVASGNVIGLPAGVPAVLPPLLLPLAGLVVLAAALLVTGRSRDGLVVAAGIPVAVAALLGLGALGAAVVPGTLPALVVRLGISVSAGLAVGAAIGLIIEVFGQDLGVGLDDASVE